MSQKKKKPIRIGIWGLGRAGYGMHLPELEIHRSEFQVVAGCDLVRAQRNALLEKHPDAAVYGKGEKFLQDPDIELVAVAIRSTDHVHFAIRALEAGKMVFLEKPIALSLRGLRRLKKAHEKFPGKLFFRHNRRFEPCYNHVLEIIRSGLLGNVFEIKLRRNQFQLRDDWQTEIECGGGQLNNWGPHIIDHALHLLESPLKTVWGNLKCVAAGGNAEDHIKAILTGENGRIVDFEISGGVAKSSPIYEVYGTRGALISRDEATLELRYVKPGKAIPPHTAKTGNPPLSFNFKQPEWVEETIPVNPSNGAQFTDIYHHLYLAIREGVPFPILPQEAFDVVRCVNKIKSLNPAFPVCADSFLGR